MRCRYNDAGWCYAPENISTNDLSGQCQAPKECPSFNCYNQPVEVIPEHCVKPQKKLLLDTILNRQPPPRQYLNYFYWKVHKPHCINTKEWAPCRVGDLAFYHTEALKYAQQRGWIE